MKVSEALDILETHNKWRRNKSDTPIKMVNPTLLGIAIETILLHYKYDVCLN